MTSDNSGGAIVVWIDTRSGLPRDVYAHHILVDGRMDPSWPDSGVAISTDPRGAAVPQIAGDGLGGAVVAWSTTFGVNSDIYANRVLPDGIVDPNWPLNGRALCTAGGTQTNPSIVSDGGGGALVSWEDWRIGSDIYAQHVLADGTLHPSWPANGIALCTAAHLVGHSGIASDSAGGAIVVWEDYRGPFVNGHWIADVYAQRVLGSGGIAPGWAPDGVAVCDAPNHQEFPAVVSDGDGGAFVAWKDRRADEQGDIYAGHVLANGTEDPSLPHNGRVICLGPNVQMSPSIVTDGDGGALILWREDREPTESDILSQHLRSNGSTDPAWPPDGQIVTMAVGSQRNPVLTSDGNGGVIAIWDDWRSGDFSNGDIYAQGVLRTGLLNVLPPGRFGLVLENQAPNPIREGMLTARLTLATADPATLEVLDVAGRILAKEEVGDLGEGTHSFGLVDSSHLPAGLYFVRLRQGTEERLSRLIVLK